MEGCLTRRHGHFGAFAAADVEPDGRHGLEVVGHVRDVFVRDGQDGRSGRGVRVHEFRHHPDRVGCGEPVAAFLGAIHGQLLCLEKCRDSNYPFMEMSTRVRSLPDAKNRSPWYLQPFTSSLPPLVRTV